MTPMQALQTFSGPDGDHEKGSIFAAKNDRVAFLKDGGYAEPLKQDDFAIEEHSEKALKK